MLSPLTLSMAELSDLRLRNRAWKENNSKFSGNHHLKHVSKVKIIRNQLCIYYESSNLCDEKDISLLWYSPPKSITCLCRRKHQTDLNWGANFRKPDPYFSKVSRSKKTREERETMNCHRLEQVKNIMTKCSIGSWNRKGALREQTEKTSGRKPVV